MELEKTTNTRGLNTALAKLAQEKCFGREKTGTTFPAETNYLDTALLPALIELQQLLETSQTSTCSEQDKSELQLENKAAKLFSHWKYGHTAAFELKFIALQESEKEIHGSDNAG